MLLALGLIRTRRPSMVLTTLLRSVSLTDLLSVDHTHTSDALEVLTLLLRAELLLTPAHASFPKDKAP